MSTHATPDSGAPLETTLRCFLQKLPGPSRLLVAVSGGSDSKGLLIALHTLLHDTPTYPVTLVAATVDHGLRAESAKEAQDVAALCAGLGIPHVTKRWHGLKPKTGVSAASRHARYSLLADAATELGANVIVTGHTADDQAETIAMRKQRSVTEDAPGLSGMADHVLYQNRIWIYRPLLLCRRQSIRDFLSAHGMDWVDDPSNSNPAYERARIRTELSKAGDRPSCTPNDRAERSKQAAELIGKYVSMPVTGVILVGNDAFDAPPLVLHHALHNLVATIGGQSHGPSEHALTQLLALFHQPSGSRVTLGRCLAHRHRTGIFLVREARGFQTVNLAIGETKLWDGRWQINNASITPLRVTTRDVSAEFSQPEAVRSIPASIVALGRQSLPQLLSLDDTALPQISDQTRCQPIISQYDSFLPGFDWPLATALAALLGARPFFSPIF